MACAISFDVRPGRFTTNKLCAARRSRCSAEPEKQVFQLTASRQNLTYDDIWAASETCDLLSGHNRDECYASFGVDSERLDMYLGKALCLEAVFKASGEDGDTSVAVPVAAVQALVAVPVQSAAFAKDRIAGLVGALGKLSNDLKKSAELMFN